MRLGSATVPAQGAHRAQTRYRRAMPPAVTYVRAPDRAVGVLTLQRPDNRNAMTPELLDAFEAARAVAADDAGLRCLIVTGTGASFCSGADFRAAVQRGDAEQSPTERSLAMYTPFLSVLDLPVPTIAACNGHAVGGGFGLALVCDLRVGARAARYGANFVRLGLHPGMAITALLPRVVGEACAAELLLTGRLVEGDEAHRLGILGRVVDAPAVMSTALALAEEIAAAAPIALALTVKTIRAERRTAAWTAARVEAERQSQTLTTADAAEGIAALLAKRAPRFTGA